MKQRFITFIGIIAFVIGMSFFLRNEHSSVSKNSRNTPIKIKSTHSPKALPQTVKDRESYFFNMLRDPAINKIPNNIRAQELALYASLPKGSLKGANAAYTWSEAGPNDVGGRTRAIGIDVRNSNIIIAGGVSGGIWKSTDQGDSWHLKNSPTETYSVTSLCQDTRDGHQNTWYYASGEFTGNSTSEIGSDYVGFGIYKSIDNGDTWSQIFGSTTAPFSWDNLSDYVSKIMVSPLDGSIYIAAHSYGIIKVIETDGTYSLTGELGDFNDHTYNDFDITSQGNIIAVLSEERFNSDTRTRAPGVYYKAFDDTEYTQIDASSTSFPSTHERSVISFAPSDPTIAYIFTNIDGDDVAFHKVDITNDQLIDRTANLPAFDDNNGKLGPQANYNMTLAIKPNDPNFIIIGNTSLFRSSNGFATPPTQDYSWIGGYSTDGSNGQYPNHHADCHINIFDPNNSNAVWSGHDGGLSYVSDITQSTSSSNPMAWVDKNNGYNITQFYAIADINMANDDRYIGGTQDNGTPSFTHDATTSSSKDISSGDGGFCYLGENYAYVSAANGYVMRTDYDAEKNPLSPFSGSETTNWTYVQPTDASGQLFINPFVINPNNEDVMYYPSGHQVWINKAIEDIPSELYSTMQGWSAPSSLEVPGYTISSMAVSKSPADILYYAAYSSSNTPLIYKVENSTAVETSLTKTDISIGEAASASYPNCIAINPQDANEIIISFSNYNVPSIFHSSDGGANYTKIDGNLSYSAYSSDPTISNVSVRSASILNWDSEKTYYISTSIGVYKTQSLNGTETTWENVAPDQLGNVVCNMIKTSDLDGKVVVATHGRGIFVGKASSGTAVNPLINKRDELQISAYPNPSNGMFKVNVNDIIADEYFVSIYNSNGRIVLNTSYNSLQDLNNDQFNLTNESAGIYILEIKAEDQAYTQKLNIR